MGKSASRKVAAAVRHERIRAKAVSLDQREAGRPRFVADVMLGRLAKWLLIAGFDVLYSNKFTDDELIAISNREGRVLLSRDTRLLIRKPVKEFIFIDSEAIQKQIRIVFETMRISSLDSPLGRCLSCNEALIEAQRESVRELVPEFVYMTQSRFKLCPACRKIFWAGTHRNAVVQTLQKLLP
jgi:uncharacterized protein